MADVEKSKLGTVSMRKEILTAGNFNGITITDSDINEMIANFNELKTRKEIPLRVGHTSDDKPNTKVMAAGWVDSLEKVGNKLVANIRNTPKQIAEFIQKELLKPISIEFLKKWKDGETGKEYKNVLTAIALMGAAQPAVPGLADFEISFNEDTENIISIEYTEEKEKQEDDNMEKELKEFQEQKKALEVELAEKEVERVKVLEEKEAAESKLKEFQERISNKEIVEFIEKNCTEKSMKILPAEKERVSRIFKALDNDTICFEEGENKLTARQEFQEFISGLGNRVEFGVESETGKFEKTDKKVEFKSDEEKRQFIAEEALKVSKEKKISFAEASLEILSGLNK